MKLILTYWAPVDHGQGKQMALACRKDRPKVKEYYAFDEHFTRDLHAIKTEIFVLIQLSVES